MMSDIELVIKIPQETYEATCSGSLLPPDVGNVVNAIKDGTLLPKGHGRLIKEDDVYDAFRPYVSFGDLYDVLDEIPTTVEADGGEEGGTDN